MLAIKVGSSPKVNVLQKGQLALIGDVKVRGYQLQARQLEGETVDIQGTTEHLVTGGTHAIGHSPARALMRERSKSRAELFSLSQSSTSQRLFTSLYCCWISTLS